MSERNVIFGSRGTGMRVCMSLQRRGIDVAYFVDNDCTQWGQKTMGLEIKNPEELRNEENVIVYCGTMVGRNEIEDQCISLGVKRENIDKTYAVISVEARKNFLNCFAVEVYRKSILGEVAEAGVYRGEFAQEINAAFPDRKCYLFDTFEGFDERDIAWEKEDSLTEVTYMNNPDLNYVINRMPHKEQIILRKGYFPETAEGITDNFVFVNLDMDLYLPTLNGLKFFYPRIVPGGVILIHDYFSYVYPNVRQAVDDYECEMGLQLVRIPIGDDLSTAIVKPLVAG